MSQDEKAILEKYKITTEQKTVYVYEGYKYDNFKDAMNYAIIASANAGKSKK